MRFFLAPSLIVSLAGCTSIVLSTAARLDGLSPLTADPAEIALAVDLPEGVGVAQGYASMFLGAKRTDTGQETGTTVNLARREDPTLGTVFMVAPFDVSELRREQALISTWKADAGDAVEGTLSIAVVPCRIGSGPEEGATASVSVRFASDESFQPLLRAAPLDRITGAAPVASWPPCS